LKNKDGKYALLALLLLLAAGGLWLFLGDEDPEPPAEVDVTAEPPVEAAPAEEVKAEIEIPPDEELETDAKREPTARRIADEPRGEASGPSPEDWVCNGTLSPTKARAVIQGAASKQVQTCYERGLKANNLLQGSMEVELTIDIGGNVRAVSIGGNIDDRQVHSCVRRVARTWKFPPPTGGCVRINVPFQLTPKL
jgi:outer membrane biosynthesis protein TonB